MKYKDCMVISIEEEKLLINLTPLLGRKEGRGGEEGRKSLANLKGFLDFIVNKENG